MKRIRATLLRRVMAWSGNLITGLRGEVIEPGETVWITDEVSKRPLWPLPANWEIRDRDPRRPQVRLLPPVKRVRQREG